MSGYEKAAPGATYNEPMQGLRTAFFKIARDDFITKEALRFFLTTA